MIESPALQSPGPAFERTLRLSRYVARIAAARPEVVEELARRGARAFDRAEMHAALEGEGRELGRRLRRLRERVMVTLAHRDLNDLATLDEVFATMTALAEECIAAAAAEAQRAVAAGDGSPDSPPIVAALGKLGGEERNASSDRDPV